MSNWIELTHKIFYNPEEDYAVVYENGNSCILGPIITLVCPYCGEEEKDRTEMPLPMAEEEFRNNIKAMLEEGFCILSNGEPIQKGSEYPFVCAGCVDLGFPGEPWGLKLIHREYSETK